MATKQDLRLQFRQRFKAWNSESARPTARAVGDAPSQPVPTPRQDAESRIAQHLINRLKSQTGTWAAFISLPSEPNLVSAIQQLRDLRWAFPRITGERMRFLVPRGDARFLVGQYGVSEPDPATADEIGIEKLDGILVPGLAFDQYGGRLGRGKGFFDRALAGFNGHTIGVAFAVQVSEEALPMDEWDIPLKSVVTENGFLPLLPQPSRIEGSAGNNQDGSERT